MFTHLNASILRHVVSRERIPNNLDAWDEKKWCSLNKLEKSTPTLGSLKGSFSGPTSFTYMINLVHMKYWKGFFFILCLCVVINQFPDPAFTLFFKYNPVPQQWKLRHSQVHPQLRRICLFLKLITCMRNDYIEITKYNCFHHLWLCFLVCTVDLPQTACY